MFTFQGSWNVGKIEKNAVLVIGKIGIKLKPKVHGKLE